MPALHAPEPASSTLRPQAGNNTLHDLNLPANGADTCHDVRVDKRQYPRKGARHGVLTIPVAIDGAPDWNRRQTATTVDLSVDGVGLVLDQPVELAATALILGFAGEAGVPTCFAGVEVIHSRRTRHNHQRLGCRFGGFADELLLPKNLTPRLDRQTLKIDLAFSEETLDKWAEAGVLTPVAWDCVEVCPRCHCLPSFRPGCAACGSARLGSDRLIHHFACAHVARVADFQAPGQLVCPKCRTHALVVGADYEYLTGPYLCHDCGWSADQLEQVAECLGCSLRFPVHQAHVQELKGYHAHRLDPLALLAASQ